MKRFSVLLLLLSAMPIIASAQNLEVSGGYAHISGDDGLDGFNVSGAFRFTPKIALAVDYDSVWDTSHVGIFELTQTGLFVSKSHLQNALIGPRVNIKGVFKSKKTNVPRLWPFVEVQCGESSLSSKLQQPTTNLNLSASDIEFTWMIGGGADYRLSTHWDARAKLDLVRTHFADTGQTRSRLALGLAYTFGKRGVGVWR